MALDCHIEILMNVSEEGVENMIDTFTEQNIPCASTGLKFYKKIKNETNYPVRFMCLKEGLKEDGPIFVLFEFNNRYELAVFSLDTSGRRIYEGLMKTKRIHFGRPIIITAVHRNLYPTVMRVLDEKNLKIASDVAQYIYCLPMEEAYRYDIDCPDGFELRRLEEHHADQIDSLWTKRFQDSSTYIALFINLSGGWGVFKCCTDQLVSWALRMALGHIGIVQTLEEYQKKGFASLVIKKIARTIAAEDESPIAFVPIGDEASQMFFEKLGFENLGTENTIELEKTDLSLIPSYSKVLPDTDDDFEHVRESAL